MRKKRRNGLGLKGWDGEGRREGGGQERVRGERERNEKADRKERK